MEWPAWFRWTIRLLVLVVIAVGAFMLYVASPVNTAGNVGIEFIGDLHQGDPETMQEAYDSLCSSEQERIGRDRFVDTGGAEYAVLTGGAVGGDGQYSGLETLDGDVKEAWIEFEIQSTGETWRLDLVRERDWWELNGEWKICGIEARDGS